MLQLLNRDSWHVFGSIICKSKEWIAGMMSKQVANKKSYRVQELKFRYTGNNDL